MTGKIKLNSASGGGSFSLQAPSSSSNNRVFTLPDVADATMATVNGITQADVWRFTSNLSCPTSSTVISANWEQVDTDSQANPIGSSMTQSSGTFTFPSTGKYLILVHQNHESTSGEGHYVYVDTYVTSDNSSYDRAARGFSNCSSGGAINTLSSSFFFDVTDVSTHKVRFYAYAYNSNQLLRGTTAYNENSYTFIKLGET